MSRSYHDDDNVDCHSSDDCGRTRHQLNEREAPAAGAREDEVTACQECIESRTEEEDQITATRRRRGSTSLTSLTSCHMSSASASASAIGRVVGLLPLLILACPVRALVAHSFTRTATIQHHHHSLHVHVQTPSFLSRENRHSTTLFSSRPSSAAAAAAASFRGKPKPRRTKASPSASASALNMVTGMSIPDNGGWSRSNRRNNEPSSTADLYQDGQRKKPRPKYQRRRIPETEQQQKRQRQERQAKYERMRSNTRGVPSIWSFEGLFPQPVWDEDTIQRDLFAVKRQDSTTESKRIARLEHDPNSLASAIAPPLKKSKPSSLDRGAAQRRKNANVGAMVVLPYVDEVDAVPSTGVVQEKIANETKSVIEDAESVLTATVGKIPLSDLLAANAVKQDRNASKIDIGLTRMVEDRVYGYRRSKNEYYAMSAMAEGAIQFRDGVRLGNPLPVNAARLNYFAKKELRKGAVDEARELYEKAIEIDPRDGRAYLGLSRCAERRRDFKLAREILKSGIANCVSFTEEGIPDKGANPFLLQALGCLEEKTGQLSRAEALYIASARSRPSHAAAWVALAQLRTRKFRQGVSAGRVCFQNAERELELAGQPPSAHVYTAWASLEYKKAGDVRRARQLFEMALEIDPRCSAAWLQLGVMEMQDENWEMSEACFRKILTFDQRNSRALQAYAILETKRPDSDSRKAIGLFERAIKANKRDSGVLQPYALYVASLGDFEGARELFLKGTQVNKRHAPTWQAWGVLETRHGTAADARNIFQQGIWACAQGGGQSGGYSCARLWQAWGVLEAREGEYAAARRCFSRALDADNRNIAAITAWTRMEEEIGNLTDAELIFERALKQFPPGTREKMRLWSLYEAMEKRAGDTAAVQEVYDRSMREALTVAEEPENLGSVMTKSKRKKNEIEPKSSRDNEIEVVRWDQGSSSMKAEVWMRDDGSVEGTMPAMALKKKKQRRTEDDSSPSS